MLLDPGMDLTLRPMRYPVFFDMYKAAIKNSWAVDEVDFSTDLTDLDRRVTPAERHLRNYLNTATRPGACALCDTTTTRRPVGLIPGS
jgi:Ribonucleotide reductase, small chain